MPAVGGSAWGEGFCPSSLSPHLPHGYGAALFPCVPGGCAQLSPAAGSGQEEWRRGGFMHPGLHPAAFSPPLKHRSSIFESRVLAFLS